MSLLTRTCLILTLCLSAQLGAEEDPAVAPPAEWIGGGIGWHEWSRMTGDWSGWRTRLEDSGILVEGLYVLDISKVESGGVRRKTTGRSLLQLTATFDLEQLLAIPRATLLVDFESFVGRNASEDAGDFQFFSNIDNPENRHEIYELRYSQSFLDERVRLHVGKMEANNDFSAIDSSAEFLNSSFAYSPAIPLVTFPDPATGVAVFLEPLPPLELGLGLYDGATQDGTATGNRGPRTFFGDPSDLFLIGELNGRWDAGGYSGRLGLGLWRHTGTFARFSGGSAGGTDGYYAILEQTLWRAPGADGDEPVGHGEGLFLAAQLAGSDRKVIEAKRHLALGFEWRGPLGGRPEDVVGLGATRVEFSDQVGSPFTENSEVSYEFFYRLQATPWLVVKPDLQHITDPGGDATLDDVTVFTLRLELSF